MCHFGEMLVVQEQQDVALSKGLDLLAEEGDEKRFKIVDPWLDGEEKELFGHSLSAEAHDAFHQVKRLW